MCQVPGDVVYLPVLMGHTCKTLSGNVDVSIPAVAAANGYDAAGKAICLEQHLTNKCPNTADARSFYMKCRDDLNTLEARTLESTTMSFTSVAFFLPDELVPRVVTGLLAGFVAEGQGRDYNKKPLSNDEKKELFQLTKGWEEEGEMVLESVMSAERQRLRTETALWTGDGRQKGGGV